MASFVSIMEPISKKIKLTDGETGQTIDAEDADTTLEVLDSSYGSGGSDDDEETRSNASSSKEFMISGKSFVFEVDHSGSDSGSDDPGGDSQYEFDEFLRPDNEIVLSSGRTFVKTLEDLQYEPTSSQETDRSDTCFNITAEIISWCVALIKKNPYVLLVPHSTLFKLSNHYRQYKLADPALVSPDEFKKMVTIKEDEEEGKETTGIYTMMGPISCMPFTFKFTLCTRRQADISLGEHLHLHFCNMERKPMWLLAIE